MLMPLALNTLWRIPMSQRTTDPPTPLLSPAPHPPSHSSSSPLPPTSLLPSRWRWFSLAQHDKYDSVSGGDGGGGVSTGRLVAFPLVSCTQARHLVANTSSLFLHSCSNNKGSDGSSAHWCQSWTTTFKPFRRWRRKGRNSRWRRAASRICKWRHDRAYISQSTHDFSWESPDTLKVSSTALCPLRFHTKRSWATSMLQLWCWLLEKKKGNVCNNGC